MEDKTEATRETAQQCEAGVPVSLHTLCNKNTRRRYNSLFVFCECRRLRENHAAVEERTNQLTSSSNSGLLVKVRHTRCTVCYGCVLV